MFTITADHGNDIPTGRVYFEGVTTETDQQLADAAGFDHRRFGYGVCRYPDEGKAVVELWND